MDRRSGCVAFFPFSRRWAHVGPGRQIPWLSRSVDRSARWPNQAENVAGNSREMPLQPPPPPRPYRVPSLYIHTFIHPYIYTYITTRCEPVRGAGFPLFLGVSYFLLSPPPTDLVRPRRHTQTLVLQLSTRSDNDKPLSKMVMTEYTYVFVIGTGFALLEAFNNGASKFRRLKKKRREKEKGNRHCTTAALNGYPPGILLANSAVSRYR